MRLLIFLITFSPFVKCLTQVRENFTDGDFTSSPVWQGTSADFVVNASNELQTNQSISATSYLSMPHGLIDLDKIEWSFRVRQTFAPSASNYGRFYLTANHSVPTGNPDGYYIQLGEAGATDAVRLFKQFNGVSTQLCSGVTGAIAASFHYRIKVTHQANGDWSLFTDETGNENYTLHQTSNDGSNLVGTHIVWQCTYTASNASKFYLDDIYVGPEIVDEAAPILLSVDFVDEVKLKASFNEPVDLLVAQNVSNYDLQPFQTITSAVVNAQNPKVVDLTVSFPMQNGNTYTLFANNMADLKGNDTTIQTASFTYFVSEIPEFGDVIINEFMADPSPAVGLPDFEFIEIYNRSGKYFDTKKWKIGDASGFGTIDATIIGPGEYLLLVATSSLSGYPTGIGVTSFPSLNNSKDDIVLTDSSGLVLDKISYTDAWYLSETKKNGGYSLERINPFLPCNSPTNWMASTDQSGGTPKSQNSVFSALPDTISPTLLSISILGKDGIQLIFNEPIDSLKWMNATVEIEPFISIENQYIGAKFSDSSTMLFSNNIVPSQVYELRIMGIEDCSQNSGIVQGKFVLAEEALPGDLVINEILFDPLTGGSDYIEVFNKTNKLISTVNLRLGRIVADTIQLNAGLNTSFHIRPFDYVVFTKDSTQVQNQYMSHLKGRFVQVDLPSYNNDSSTVILANGAQILDRVSYSDEWHFGLLDSKDGKALERLSVDVISNTADNWHTASESSGFGTPGLKNSQRIGYEPKGEFDIPNLVVSPDNDGYEDVLVVNYQLMANETLLTVGIYDQLGRKVRLLKNNELVGESGTFVWDGLNEDGLKASIGQYVLLAQGFSLNGENIFSVKKAIVVAGKI
ncbi:MAG: lamin tail domain-containing protein [Bacteroidetes bacterium]|nr:lamin tail domain-containing protein [Bacteroidota bacterium]